MSKTTTTVTETSQSSETTVLPEAFPNPENAVVASTLVTPGRPASLLEVQEELPANTDGNINYPKGKELWLTLTSVLMACVIYGLDMTIIAVAVPSVTDDFKSIRDIGWYTAV